MSQFSRGDVVSLSRAQTTKVAILTTPLANGEAYSVTVPIAPGIKTFTYTASLGQTLAQIAAGLLAVLLQQQTVYSVAIDPEQPTEIVFVGPIGETYEVVTTANAGASLVAPAVLAIDHRTGEAIGPIRLLEVTDTLERLREFVTRDRDGNTLVRNQLQGREIGSSNVFDFDSSQVLTVLHREGG